jgi:hypothetical protein
MLVEAKASATFVENIAKQKKHIVIVARRMFNNLIAIF